METNSSWESEKEIISLTVSVSLNHINHVKSSFEIVVVFLRNSPVADKMRG